MDGAAVRVLPGPPQILGAPHVDWLPLLVENVNTTSSGDIGLFESRVQRAA